MNRTIGSAVRSAVELLFPSRCVHCGTEGSMFCEACIDASTALTGPVCDLCALPMPAGSRCARCAQSKPDLDRMVAAFAMDGPIRSAIHALKYNDLRALASPMGTLLAAHPPVGRMQIDAVVPIPLHARRMRSRGYNQSELLARVVAESIGVRLRADLVKRVVDTPSQVDAPSASERARAMSNAFAANPSAHGLRILLIDDVATTTSTLNACARALKGAGAARVAAAVLGREL